MGKFICVYVGEEMKFQDSFFYDFQEFAAGGDVVDLVTQEDFGEDDLDEGETSWKR